MESQLSPKEAIEIINALMRDGRLDDRGFRQLHHLGGSIAGFVKYCSTIKAFHPNGHAAELAQKLREMHPTNGIVKREVL